MKIETVLFDNDGVLVDSEFIAAEVFLRLTQPFGYADSHKTYYQRFAGMNTHEILAALEPELSLRWPPDFLQKMMDAFQFSFENDLRPIAGMPTLVRSLGYQKAVVSNSNFDHLERCMKRADLWDLMKNDLFSAKMVKNGKPAPDIYLLAVKNLGASAASTIAVEDSKFGVQAAKSAGLRVVGFLGASHIFEGHDQALLDAGADFLAKDAAELSAILTALS